MSEHRESTDPLQAIRRLYHQARPSTIERDIRRAIALLKSMKTEAERERAAVYMDGLSQLRSEWAAGRRAKGGPRAKGASG